MLRFWVFDYQLPFTLFVIVVFDAESFEFEQRSG
ncbi:hypothetical protein BVRB_6g137100 [Beta vulgaris subsp. vulgaris]|nr:hypothetical protein BVRB_6g137100 [Beta vulgaris subsp. vulgaris]